MHNWGAWGLGIKMASRSAKELGSEGECLKFMPTVSSLSQTATRESRDEPFNRVSLFVTKNGTIDKGANTGRSGLFLEAVFVLLSSK